MPLERKRCCAFGKIVKDAVYHELMKSDQTFNPILYNHQMINLNNALIEKRPVSGTKYGKVILQRGNAHHTQRQWPETPLLYLSGKSFKPTVLNRTGPFRLPLVLIHVSRILCETLQKLQRCLTMA